jgi:RNA 2',3'-cyclic 3'-phosphodiesterase
MRLFLGIAIDDGAREAASAVVADLRRRLARERADGALKWVEHENLHVTLRFLGQVDAAVLPPLQDALRPPIGFPPLELVIGGAGCFPPSGPPRVLWLGVARGVGAARRIYDELDRRLGPFGFEREARAYSPHVTLGRVRELRQDAGRRLREGLKSVTSPLVSLTVRHVTLYRSHLSSAGPRYEVLMEIPLSPGADVA